MIPYAPSTPYQRNATVADLMMQAGNQQAQAQLQKGAVWGRALNDIGQIAGGAVQDYQAEKAKKAQADAISKRDQAFVQTLQQNGGKLDLIDAVRIYGPKDGPVIAKGLFDFQQAQGKTGQDAMSHLPGIAAAYLKLSPGLQKSFYESQLRPTAIAGGLFKETDLPEKWSPEINTSMMSLASAFAPTEKAVEVSPGASMWVPGSDKPAFTAPVAPKEKAPTGKTWVVRGGKVIPIEKGTEQEGDTPYEKAPAASQSRTWVMRNGSPVFVRESEVMPGDKPANTREQGRPVTSGDSTKLSEIDNGIAQAEKLKSTMNTGAASWLGSKTPDFVTQATGLGAESKAQQANIQLVKQIIGKGLEGGVLRKEDEAKYERILPKLGDAPEVAQSKINELIDLLRNKKEIELNAKEDAGYDVSKFRERETAPKTEASSNPLAVTAPDGKTYTFPNKAQADAFKKRAGIK